LKRVDVDDKTLSLFGANQEPKPEELAKPATSSALPSPPASPPDRSAREAFFSKQVEKARAMGFKPGFASAQYREKFGEWPPRSWSEKAKIAQAGDSAWLERSARREAIRSAQASQEAKERAALAHFEDSPTDHSVGDAISTPTDEVDSPFADWVDEVLGHHRP
jgi:hypothetical protein